MTRPRVRVHPPATVLPGAHPLRTALFRALFLLWVTTLFGGDIFRGYHLLTTRHVVCAEHGELVDVDEARSRVAIPRRGTGVEAQPAVPTSDHHVHCKIAALRTADQHGVAGPGAACAGTLVRPATFLKQRALPSLGSVPPLAFAPKQSPPLAAAIA